MIQREVRRLSMALVRLSLIKGSCNQVRFELILNDDLLSLMLRAEQLNVILERLHDGRSNTDDISKMRLINESRLLCEQVELATMQSVDL